ncbi:hypothetical protein PAGA_a1965 [Pseudoalteromonas agarivorans DSM 14585]|uniref:Uncharacterized protein n=1 Tax=Pseudoalteromonas agarivorans DSM 14585 TaxID=1312369 RepID=A0ACA8DWI0_9GAMM|nr:hypothetical protein PAGA_a1965 [Pseudoalteromonas agarivorans DSM 14585]
MFFYCKATSEFVLIALRVYKHSLIYFLCKNKLKQLPSVTR